MARLLGYLFAALALAAFSWDIWSGPVQGGELSFASTAEHWFSYHKPSLIGLNSFIEKQVSPELWDIAVLPAINMPAFALFGAIAFLFMLLAGLRRRAARSNLMFPRGRR